MSKNLFNWWRRMRGQVSGNEFVTVSGGARNLAKGEISTILGGIRAATDNYGQVSHASGDFGTRGGAQRSVYILRRVTGDSVARIMFLNGLNAGMFIRSETAWSFRGMIVGVRVGGTYETASWIFEGLIRRETTLASTTLVGSNITKIASDAGATWDGPVIQAGTSTGNLVIRAKGNTAETVNWVATVEVIEVKSE